MTTPSKPDDELDDEERELIRRHRENKAQPDATSQPTARLTPTADKGTPMAAELVTADALPGSSRATARRKRTIIIVCVAVVLLAGLGIGLGISLSGGTKSGFYNMQTLANSVQQQINTNPNYEIGDTVEGCSMVSGQTAECTISDLAGGTSGITVLISADGNSWTQQ